MDCPALTPKGSGVKVAPFRIEQYYDRYEFATRYMLSSSDCESRAISELLSLEPDAGDRLLDLRCGYTESAGSLELREAIAALYESVDPDEVVVTSCAGRGSSSSTTRFLLPEIMLSSRRPVTNRPCSSPAVPVPR